MAEVTVRPVVPGDTGRLLAGLRAGDRAELDAYFPDPRAGIEWSLANSLYTGAAEVNGELLGLFGVGPVTALSDVGVPWLLTTHVVDRHPRAFMRASRRYLIAMRSHYPQLVNYVDARYGASIRWLARLGFTLGAPVPVGPDAIPFHRFEIGGGPCVGP